MNSASKGIRALVSGLIWSFLGELEIMAELSKKYGPIFSLYLKEPERPDAIYWI
jgi:hypothetical protein